MRSGRGAALRVREWAWAGAILLAGVLMGAAAMSGESAAAPFIPASQPKPATASPLPPGWAARFGRPGDKPRDRIGTHTPTAAFALRPGETVHPGIAPPGFEASYDADITIAAAGRYRFGAEVEGGKLTVTVVGKALKDPVSVTLDRGAAGARGGSSGSGPLLTPWINLPAGTIGVQYVFTRTGDAPARLRALWQQDRTDFAGFALEPIPPTVATVGPYGVSDATTGLTAFRGRVLLGELGCVNCHNPGPGGAAAVLERKGPVLTGVGARLNPQWIARWLQSPQAVKPGCDMPGLPGGGTPAEVESLTHFLVSLGGPAPYEAAATEADALRQGRDLFTTLGCIACHGPLDEKDGGKGFTPAAPYGDLAGKWNVSALADFLHDPRALHPAGRMPSLDITHAEADLLAAYLVNTWGPAPQSTFTVDPAKAATGRAAFTARGCVACHDAEEGGKPLAASRPAKALAQLRPTAGCLDPKNTATPRYTISESDRTALAAAITSAKSWAAAAAVAPVDSALRTVEALGCARCHEFNGAGGVHDGIKRHFTCTVEADLGDEGRIPPRLTGVGGKLNTPWLKSVLTESGRARPYMAARMPQYSPKALGDLANHLAALDGVWPDSDKPDPVADTEKTQAGLKLVGDTGLNCISCHTFGSAPPTGTPGPSITDFAGRLRYDWFSRFIVNPGRVKPGTKMTNFFVTGSSGVTEVFGGDAAKQTEALWAYFTMGGMMPPPAGIEVPSSFQLPVGDRPKVIRTFLKRAGSRGIAIGFPERLGGVHFAFDAGACRLVEAWTGNFLDASGAWAGRGGQTAGGQGDKAWSAPPGPPLVIGPQPAAWPDRTGRDAGYRFRGYTIDAQGVPTFMYEIAAGREGATPIRVQERFEPIPKSASGASPRVRRHFELIGVPRGEEAMIWYNAGSSNAKVSAEGAAPEPVDLDDGSVIYGIKPGDEAAAPVVITVEITP